MDILNGVTLIDIINTGALGIAVWMLNRQWQHISTLTENYQDLIERIIDNQQAIKAIGDREVLHGDGVERLKQR